MVSTQTIRQQSRRLAATPVGTTGVLIALAIGALWATLLTYLVAFYQPDWQTPWPYLGILAQMHLYTGLFITAHDAMHGVVSANKRANDLIGGGAALLFAYNWFPRMRPKHHQHHQHVGTADDPDFHDGRHPSFLLWFVRFAWNYVTWWQIVLMALTYNLLKWAGLPIENLIAFWMVPAVLATLQLFYFGTYLPHRGEHAHDNPHKSRTQFRHHLWAFVSCYFFGYHYEHHDQPYLPWWRLWRTKAVS